VDDGPVRNYGYREFQAGVSRSDSQRTADLKILFHDFNTTQASASAAAQEALQASPVQGTPEQHFWVAVVLVGAIVALLGVGYLQVTIEDYSRNKAAATKRAAYLKTRYGCKDSVRYDEFFQRRAPELLAYARANCSPKAQAHAYVQLAEPASGRSRYEFLKSAYDLFLASDDRINASRVGLQIAKDSAGAREKLNWAQQSANSAYVANSGADLEAARNFAMSVSPGRIRPQDVDLPAASYARSVTNRRTNYHEFSSREHTWVGAEP